MGSETEPMRETVKMRGGHVITAESYCSGTIVCYLVQGQGTLAERGPHFLGQQTASGHENTARQQKRSGKEVYFGLFICRPMHTKLSCVGSTWGSRPTELQTQNFAGHEKRLQNHSVTVKIFKQFVPVLRNIAKLPMCQDNAAKSKSVVMEERAFEQLPEDVKPATSSRITQPRPPSVPWFALSASCENPPPKHGKGQPQQS